MRTKTLMAIVALAPSMLTGCGGGSGDMLSSDGTLAVAPSPSPSPTATASPTPTPTPTATTASSGSTVVGSNSAEGYPQLEKIAANYDRGSMLVPAHGNGAIAPSNAPDSVGAFRLICAPSHLAYDDPIVFPGQPGKSHLHVFFGNTKSDANSDYQSLRTTGESTCGALNRSAYWMPALADGKGNVVLPDYVAVYYKRRPGNDPECQPGSITAPKGCVGLPRGLRYIFGRTMEGGTYADERTDGINFVCVADSSSSKDFADILSKCPVGSEFIIQMGAPDCWNGKYLDTPDHRAHMRHTIYNNKGQEVCPTGFPYRTPNFHFNVSFTIRAGASNWYFVSDRMPGRPALPAGSTVHADWFGAWDDDTLATWVKNCIDGFRNGNSGDLCDGTQMKGAAAPSYGWNNPNAVVPIPANPLG